MGWWIRVFILAAIFRAVSAHELPQAEEVLKRVQARMESVCADSPTNRLHYYRTNVIEELDSSGKLKKRTVKIYEALQVQVGKQQV